MPRGHGEIQQKVLLLLLGGLALGLSGSPKTYFKVLGGIAEDWKEIERRALKRSVSSLYGVGMVKEKRNKDGTFTITLTKRGKKHALKYDMDKMKIKKPKRWDGKWRMVLFDIPEIHKKEREALRFRIKKLGFCEFQKSVFIYPYDCKKEIGYIVEFHGIEKFVRFVVADSLDNEKELKKHFSS